VKLDFDELRTIQRITSVQGKGLTVIARLPYRNARTALFGRR